MIVAIDGPAGAGKSTVARALAERLGFRYLDTGAMYRALDVARDPARRCRSATRTRSARSRARTRSRSTSAAACSIAGTDVTAAIRQSRVDRMVPVVARHPEVREVMRERQRELGGDGDVVIEGRDIGTVVAPDAEVKVYLVADPEVRARRREAERPDIGADALATDLKLRDESDHARMQPADDAERDRHDRPRGRRRRGPDRGARPGALARRECAPWPTETSPGRPRGYYMAPLAIFFARGRGYGLDRIPLAGRLRARDQPPRLDRHAARRRALAAEHQLRREGRGAPGARARLA